MISTKMKRLTPRSQENIDHWHYSHSLKVDEATAKKKTVVHIYAFYFSTKIKIKSISDRKLYQG